MANAGTTPRSIFFPLAFHDTVEVSGLGYGEHESVGRAHRFFELLAQNGTALISAPMRGAIAAKLGDDFMGRAEASGLVADGRCPMFELFNAHLLPGFVGNQAMGGHGKRLARIFREATEAAGRQLDLFDVWRSDPFPDSAGEAEKREASALVISIFRILGREAPTKLEFTPELAAAGLAAVKASDAELRPKAAREVYLEFIAGDLGDEPLKILSEFSTWVAKALKRETKDD